MKLAISTIKINGRHRRDMGDVQSLAESIRTLGLLQPVVITRGNDLVAGERRIAAARLLKWTDIPVTVAETIDDALKHLQAERDENTCRKDFSPSEAVAVGKALEEIERPKAKERQRDGGKRGGEGSGKLPQASPAKTRDKIAPAVGMSPRTYEKAKAVVEKAAAQPEFADLARKMDESGKVDRAFKAMRHREAEDERRKSADAAAKATPPEDFGVKASDFRTLAATIPPDSVDLIFTDPPYDRETLPLYGDLAKAAARILKPGGSLICYLGQYQIGEVCNLIAPHLRLWWTLACLHTGHSARMNEYGIVVKWKPMLWFVKGTRRDKLTMVDDLVTSAREKHAHEWQQSVIEASYYIEKLTIKGEMVFDPFCGGGTTAVAAKQLGRRWLTCDVDDASVKLARKRIHTEGGLIL